MCAKEGEGRQYDVDIDSDVDDAADCAATAANRLGGSPK